MRTEKVTERKTQQSHSYLKVGDLQLIKPSAGHLTVIGHLDLTGSKAGNKAITSMRDPMFELVPFTHTTIQQKEVNNRKGP